MSQVIQFPTFSEYGPKREAERRRLAKMFAGKSVAVIRNMWDEVGDDSFYHAPDGGMFDCADIHSYLNMLGDSAYCAV